MSTPTHILAGVALGTLANTTMTNTEPFTRVGIVVLAIVFSILPDINMLWKKRLQLHHKDPTHYPAITLVVGGLLFLAELLLGSSFVITKLWLACMLFHLFLDTFGSVIGVHWFWPFSKKQFSFLKLNSHVFDAHVFHRTLAYIRSVGQIEVMLDIILLFVVFTYWTI